MGKQLTLGRIDGGTADRNAPMAAPPRTSPPTERIGSAAPWQQRWINPEIPKTEPLRRRRLWLARAMPTPPTRARRGTGFDITIGQSNSKDWENASSHGWLMNRSKYHSRAQRRRISNSGIPRDVALATKPTRDWATRPGGGRTR